MDMPNDLLLDLLAWGQRVKGFQSQHAMDALSIVEVSISGMKDKYGRKIPGLGANGKDVVFAFALDLTMIFWMDDCFDSHLLPDIGLKAIEVFLGGEAPSTEEARAFFDIKELFSRMAKSRDDFNLWQEFCYFSPFKKEAMLSKGQLQMSYAEYLENGYKSICLPRTLASASVLWGLDISRRYSDPHFARLIRNQGIVARLENDLFSLERELKEASQANALLVVGRFMSKDKARAFIESELDGYIRLVEHELTYFDEEDPIICLGKIFLAMGDLYYGASRKRYHDADTN